MKSIPMSLLSSFSEVVPLGNKVYTLSFGYNQSGNFWYVDIADVNETEILNGVKLCINQEIVADFAKDSAPPNLVVVNPLENYDAVNNFEDFVNGRSVLLFDDEA